MNTLAVMSFSQWMRENGSNATNCHFSFFATPELMKAWEMGKASVEKVGV